MNNDNIVLEVKDHSVSGEEFQLIKHDRFEILETRPQPKPDQLEKYYSSNDYISHTNSRRNLFEHAYHFVRNIALKRKLNLINGLGTNEKKLLDIGCGTGNFLKAAKDSKWDVVGIEPNASARKIATDAIGNNVHDEDCMSSLLPNSFDVITLWHVLEHLPNINSKILEIKSLLRKDGVLIVAVPNYKSYDAQYYKDKWAAYDVPRHFWHFSQIGMKSLFSEIEMKITQTRPMKFDAYYVALLSEKYKSGRMRFLRAFWVAFKSNWIARKTSEHSSLIYVIKKNN